MTNYSMMQNNIPYKKMLPIAALLALVGFIALGCAMMKGPTGSASLVPSCKDCNLILISLDTLRADHLGTYGYGRNTSPVIDELADQSIVFHNAFVNGYFTLPSHMSIFTSTYPIRHKINYQRYDLINPENNSLSEDIPTFAQLMGQSGYHTTWVAPFTDPHLELGRGFERGFSEFQESIFTLYTGNSTLLQNHFDNFFKRANTSASSRFFWFMHSYALHSPYIQPQPFSNRFSYEDYGGRLPDNYPAIFKIQLERISKSIKENSTALKEKLAIDSQSFSRLQSIVESKNISALSEYRISTGRPIFDRTIGYPGIIYYDTIRGNITESDITQLKNNYDAGIYYMDFQLGLFFDGLKKAGLWNNTIIILTSDHGDELYEHQGFDHTNFYDHTIHVPLLIHVPGMENRMDVWNLTQSIDIMPTALRILTIQSPKSIQGKDIISVLEGKEKSNEYVFGFSRGNMYIRSMEWKHMLRNSGKEELYYLIDDPEEQKNLINATETSIAAQREKLRKQLLHWSEK